MKNFLFIPVFATMMLAVSCAPAAYTNNGEAIYRTGKNADGTPLLDKSRSTITIIKSCRGCHGTNGERISGCNIKWTHLTDPRQMNVPYTDSLFARFLDEDLKSDGTPAETGVHWKLSERDKKDLIGFLKTL